MKKRRINGIIIKSFIVIAVVMMLISVMPGEGAVNEKSKITERLYIVTN